MDVSFSLGVKRWLCSFISFNYDGLCGFLTLLIWLPFNIFRSFRRCLFEQLEKSCCFHLALLFQFILFLVGKKGNCLVIDVITFRVPVDILMMML